MGKLTWAVVWRMDFKGQEQEQADEFKRWKQVGVSGGSKREGDGFGICLEG